MQNAALEQSCEKMIHAWHSSESKQLNIFSFLLDVKYPLHFQFNNNNKLIMNSTN